MHLGLIGYGSIATNLIELLSPTQVTAITVLTRTHTIPDIPSNMPNLRFVTSLKEFVDRMPDLVVECAGHSAVSQYVPTLLDAHIDVILASVGALADDALHQKLKAAASNGASRFILPSGAIGGLDILSAISQTSDVDLTYQGIKPALSWTGTPAEDILELSNLTEPTTFYKGSGRNAALTYPKNANVVAALALAGGGFDRMKVELIADPDAQSIQHTYHVIAPHCRYSITIESTPSTGNARTSKTTVLSILKAISDHQTAASYAPK